MSVNNTNPSTLFGGTWEQLKDRFLLGSGDTYTNGDTGGEATHKLTVNEMPKHRHNFPYYGDVSGGGGGANGLPYNATNNSRIGYDYAGMGYTGSDQPHNNMPPYLVVYMWKRIS